MTKLGLDACGGGFGVLRPEAAIHSRVVMMLDILPTINIGKGTRDDKILYITYIRQYTIKREVRIRNRKTFFIGC